MRKWTVAIAGLALGLGVLVRGGAEERKVEPARAAGLAGWEKSLEAARTRAERERKPILLLHLFGRLDEELC